MHVHYCMGKLAGWEIGLSESNTCGKCGMQKSLQKSNGCCNDESKLLQNNTDQRITTTDFKCTQQTTPAIAVCFVELPVPVFTQLKTASGIDSPPWADTVAVYIRNCVFRI